MVNRKISPGKSLNFFCSFSFIVNGRFLQDDWTAWINDTLSPFSSICPVTETFSADNTRCSRGKYFHT